MTDALIICSELSSSWPDDTPVPRELSFTVGGSVVVSSLRLHACRWALPAIRAVRHPNPPSGRARGGPGTHLIRRAQVADDSASHVRTRIPGGAYQSVGHPADTEECRPDSTAAHHEERRDLLTIVDVPDNVSESRSGWSTSQA